MQLFSYKIPFFNFFHDLLHMRKPIFTKLKIRYTHKESYTTPRGIILQKLSLKIIHYSSFDQLHSKNFGSNYLACKCLVMGALISRVF